MLKIDPNTAKKVMDILSNPEMLNKISALASNISGSNSNPASPSAPVSSELSTLGNDSEAFSSRISQSIPQAFNEGITNSKANVLLALKPLLKEEKKSKVDAVIKALTVASAISRMKGGKNNV